MMAIMLNMLGVAFLIMLFTMTVTWLLQKVLHNAGIVDVTWSYNFLLVALVYYSMADGFMERKLLISCMVAAWSFRLGTHLLVRVGGHIKQEDGRYLQLRKEWAENLQFKFFLFFQFQGVLNLLLSLPFLLIVLNTNPEITFLEWAGVGLWVVAFLGESIADWQLKSFKSKPQNAGKVCDAGLWFYSRHPNYFFEWLIWVAYFIFALAAPYGWISIICPLLMLHFLYRVTGIPMTEEQAVRSKGNLYKEYQKTTSAFVPWFKKNSKL
jgi:steroid 5-alpha reductase family enzyme